MGVFIFAVGMALGLLVGCIFGMCQMDNLHRRVNSDLDKYGRDKSVVSNAKKNFRPKALPPKPPKPLHNPNI